MIRTSLLTIALGLATTLPAMAEEHPLLHPSRDVMVEYRMLGANAGQHRPDTMRMYYTSGGMKMRVEPVGLPTYTIVDRAADRVMFVMTAQHIYTEMMYNPKLGMEYDDSSATITHTGSDTVAGISCTVYQWMRQGRSGHACVTSDGVMLRAINDDPAHPNSGMEATSVVYGAQPATLFAPPPDFRKVDMATMGRGMAPPPSK